MPLPRAARNQEGSHGEDAQDVGEPPDPPRSAAPAIRGDAPWPGQGRPRDEGPGERPTMVPRRGPWPGHQHPAPGRSGSQSSRLRRKPPTRAPRSPHSGAHGEQQVTPRGRVTGNAPAATPGQRRAADDEEGRQGDPAGKPDARWMASAPRRRELDGDPPQRASTQHSQDSPLDWRPKRCALGSLVIHGALQGEMGSGLRGRASSSPRAIPAGQVAVDERSCAKPSPLWMTEWREQVCYIVPKATNHSFDVSHAGRSLRGRYKRVNSGHQERWAQRYTSRARTAPSSWMRKEGLSARLRPTATKLEALLVDPPGTPIKRAGVGEEPRSGDIEDGYRGAGPEVVRLKAGNLHYGHCPSHPWEGVKDQK